MVAQLLLIANDYHDHDHDYTSGSRRDVTHEQHNDSISMTSIESVIMSRVECMRMRRLVISVRISPHIRTDGDVVEWFAIMDTLALNKIFAHLQVSTISFPVSPIHIIHGEKNTDSTTCPEMKQRKKYDTCVMV